MAAQRAGPAARTGPPPRVLAAVSAEGRERVSAILHGWEVCVAAEQAEALRLLASRRFDLIIIGASFDASTAMELFQEILRLEVGCPVVCVRAASSPSGLGPGSFDAFRSACEVLGAAEVMDLLAFPDDDSGHARARRMLERLLPPGG